MKNCKTNIIIRGMMRSGSHAIVDLLSEYDNVAITQGELNEYKAAGMVSDMLDNELSMFWDDWTDNYVSTYNQSFRHFKSLLSKWVINDKRILKLLYKSEYLNIRIKKLVATNKLIKLNETLKQNLPYDDKIKIANGWIQSLGDIYSEYRPEVEFALFDNPISTISHIEVFSRVFSPFKLICIIRDPRDHLANIIKDRYIYLPYGPSNYHWGGMAVETIYGRSRKDAIRLFIDLITINYKRLALYKKQIPENNVLIVKFEDIVQDYKNTKSRIEDFVGGLSGHHKNMKTSFIPEASQKNIGYFNDYLSADEITMLLPLINLYQEFGYGGIK